MERVRWMSRDQRVTQGLNCSSRLSRAAIESASRRVGNLPTRTRYTDGVPLAGLSDDALTSLCERTIRNHDPCISCATHFLTLTVDRR